MKQESKENGSNTRKDGKKISTGKDKDLNRNSKLGDDSKGTSGDDENED